jgi:hypothetical protein
MNIREEIAHLAQPIGNFKTHPKNVRQGDVGAISQSLNAHGQYRAIVVQKSTGYILAGNHTFLAAKSLGWQQIAATFVDCDDEQAIRILLVDNRANDLAMYDDRALADLLKELTATNSGLDGSLFTGDDLDDLLFRLEGTLGEAYVGNSITENKADYEQRDTRTLLFPLSVADYTDMAIKLKALREEYGEDDNSELLKRIINAAYEQLPTDGQ